MAADILVIMTDQHRADWIGANDGDWVRTPALDGLASEGVTFTSCFTTCPICMPARASFLTGMYPHNFGMWNNVGRVQDTGDTYLHPLREAGYRTCHVGKSHLHPHGRGRDLRDAEPYMHALGWDDVLECTGPLSTQTTSSILTDWMRSEGVYELFLDDYRKRREHDGPALWPSLLPDGKHADDFMANAAIDYIDCSDRSQPLFMFVGLGGPHEPYDPPERFDAYDPADMPSPLPKDPEPGWLSGPALEHHRQMMGRGDGVTPEQWARMRSLYSARVEHVDHLMGRVVDAWHAARERDTWVIFWSDHGDMLGDKGRTAKSVFYDASVRVPAIIRPPSGCTPVRCDGLTSILDLTASVLDAGAARPSQNVFGTSLLPALSDQSYAGRRSVISEIYGRTMVYDGRWKMVLNKHNDILKLFDTRSDPREALNLAGKPGTEPEVERLRGELVSFLLGTADNQWRDVNG